MLMVAVLSFSILSVTAFCLKNKRLHLFEILAIWFTVMAVNSPIYSYFLTNHHWISVPDNRELAVVRIVYTEVLNPLFISWVMDEVLPRNRFFVRVACYSATLGILFLGGWTLDKWGVIRFNPIGWWLYTPIKSIVLIAPLCSIGLIRYLVRKDGVRLDPVSRD
jgi:hypothetical protein